MRKLASLSASIAITILSSHFSFAADDKFTDNLDGGKISCKSPSGDEIKKFQSYPAPSDRFFVEDSIKIDLLSGGAPKSHKCEITKLNKENIKVKTDYGEIEVSVVKSFEAFAGADCGTDPAKYFGKTANIECTVSATMRKYTNK